MERNYGTNHHNNGQERQPLPISEALNADKMTEFRSEQWNRMSDHLDNNNYVYNDIYAGRREFLSKELPNIQANYLKEHEIAKEDPHYAVYDGLLKEASINPFSKYGDDWNIPDENGLTGYQRYQARYEGVFASSTDTPAAPADSESSQPPVVESLNTENSEETEQSKTLEELQGEIDILQNKVNTTFAKRMKVGVFRRKKKAALQVELDEQNTELQALMEQRNTALVEQLRSENLSDEMIVEKLAEQANAEINKQGKGQREAMIGKNSFKRRMNQAMEYYANLDRPRKLAFGVLVGLGGISAGVGLSTIGALGAGVGAAGLAGVRAVRTYQLRKTDLYKTPDTPPPIEYKDGDTFRSIEDVLQDANTYQNQVTSERIEKGDKIKRRAVYWSMGAIAVGGTIAAAEHADSIGGAAGWVKDRAIDAKEGLGNGWNSLFGDDSAQAIEANPDDKVPGGNPPLAPEGGGGPAPSETPDDNNFDFNQFADAAEISHGEGWYQTFGEMGISNPYDQQQLLNNDVLMAKLSNMGVAYLDPSVGGYGMNFGSGSMPPEALKLIHDTAVQSHIPVAR